jgi:hypothetical protein
MATDRFEGLARQSAEQSGLVGTAVARIVVVEHPIGGVAPVDLDRRARRAVDDIISLWLGTDR